MSTVKKLTSSAKRVTSRVAGVVKSEFESDEVPDKKRKQVKSEPIESSKVEKKNKKTSSSSSSVKSENEEDSQLNIFYTDKPVIRKDGVFTFPNRDDATDEEVAYVSRFHPNKSPEEVLRAGAFGGTYFRTIRSGVLQKTLSKAWKELPKEWVEGLNPAIYLERPWKEYDTTINKFGVKSGTTLEDWESSGWISPIDPYGMCWRSLSFLKVFFLYAHSFSRKAGFNGIVVFSKVGEVGTMQDRLIDGSSAVGQREDGKVTCVGR